MNLSVGSVLSLVNNLKLHMAETSVEQWWRWSHRGHVLDLEDHWGHILEFLALTLTCSSCPWPCPQVTSLWPWLCTHRSPKHIRTLRTEAGCQYNYDLFFLISSIILCGIALKVGVSVSHILWQSVHKFAEHQHRLLGLCYMFLT